jgi:hypothetical protein
MTTRSNVLFRAHITTTAWSTIFQPVTGWSAIVKSIAIQNNAASTHLVNVILEDTLTGLQVGLVNESLAQNGLAYWSGWTMLEQDDAIVIWTDSTDVSLWGSGTDLPMAPQLG